jgi:hypothetical protein
MSWVAGDNLYHIAFDLSGFPLIQHLSGVVDILETVWNEDEGLLSFIVRAKKDRLFEEGDFIAQPLRRFRRTRMGMILVETQATCPSCRGDCQSGHAPG